MTNAKQKSVKNICKWYNRKAYIHTSTQPHTEGKKNDIISTAKMHFKGNRNLNYLYTE